MQSNKSLLLLLACCALPASPAAAAAAGGVRDFCIVGAGPGGLQLGHYMHAAGRDYVIFERQPGPGHFFKHLPRHRKLI
eukprot:SAG31_NODE_10376_length_1146_cov_1.295129_1_plen_78_part_10